MREKSILLICFQPPFFAIHHLIDIWRSRTYESLLRMKWRKGSNDASKDFVSVAAESDSGERTRPQVPNDHEEPCQEIRHPGAQDDEKGDGVDNFVDPGAAEGGEWGGHWRRCQWDQKWYLGFQVTNHDHANDVDDADKNGLTWWKDNVIGRKLIGSRPYMLLRFEHKKHDDDNFDEAKIQWFRFRERLNPLCWP